MNKPTQKQMFYKEQKKIAETKQIFLEFAQDGLTKQELQNNIDKNPKVWKQFENWLKVLPVS